MGSSPLTRGKLDGAGPVGVGLGLIPAHAGKTGGGRSRGGLGRAHPRSRGENSRALRSRRLEKGSSPLTRGKPPRRGGRRLPRGLIPAHAGKTSVLWVFVLKRGAHPRSRGENQPDTTITGGGGGSSPLTRGKPHLSRDADVYGGLIPAHAGKTLPDLRFYRADRSDLGKP